MRLRLPTAGITRPRISAIGLCAREWKLAVKMLAVVSIFLSLCSQAAVAGQPNVVVFLADDQGWGDLRLNGNTNLNTPAIDSLARDGASFNNFYVCPVCSPTRAEFLTGRYHPRLNVTSTSAGGERMDLGVATVADVLKNAGYRTAAFGKWHSGMQYPYHPCGRGFEEFYGFCSGHWGNYFNPLLERNGELVQGKGFCVDDFTNQAIDFMHGCVTESEPFFAYLPYNTPHSPMQVPDRYWQKFENAELQLRNRAPKRENIGHTRAALAMVENIDANVSNVLQKLDEWGVAENTIVIYFTDNGPNGFRWNGGMKGRKGSTDEGGVRSPLLVRYPKRIKAGQQVEQISAAIDLLPTLADLAGVDLSKAQLPVSELDGISVAPLLLDDQAKHTWPDRTIVSHWNNRVSVRNQRFRLDNSGKLYDIEADRGQTKDVAALHPTVHAKLQANAETFRSDILSQRKSEDKRPFTLGAEEFRYTQIPARDAKYTGGLVRSNKYPNCSFLTNWYSVEQEIYWPVQVLSAGEYQVSMLYTCPVESVGSRLRLQIGDAALEKQIKTAWNPPLFGSEDDRVQRTESYVKEFAVLEMGSITLTPGKFKLSLSATDVAGPVVADFRLLMFKKR